MQSFWKTIQKSTRIKKIRKKKKNMVVVVRIQYEIFCIDIERVLGINAKNQLINESGRNTQNDLRY